MKISLLLLLFFVFPAFAFSTGPGRSAPGTSWRIAYRPEKIVNGAPILFEVRAPSATRTLSGKWLDHEVFFSYDRSRRLWYGLAGASLETKPGSYPLRLESRDAAGRTNTSRKLIRVRAASYPSIAISVGKQFTEPDPQQLRQINQDKTLKQDVFRSFTPDQEWSGRFEAPVDARVSDIFGTQRTFNGKVQSFHQGLDYAVPQGTPVGALNSGTVILARSLYYEGNCVAIDHGQGLLSLYLHLSEFKVHEGDKVKRGDVLGLSGGTGRATGPHLHIAVRWQGIYVDPATLLKLSLPQAVSPPPR